MDPTKSENHRSRQRLAGSSAQGIKIQVCNLGICETNWYKWQKKTPQGSFLFHTCQIFHIWDISGSCCIYLQDLTAPKHLHWKVLWNVFPGFVLKNGGEKLNKTLFPDELKASQRRTGKELEFMSVFPTYQECYGTRCSVIDRSSWIFNSDLKHSFPALQNPGFINRRMLQNTWEWSIRKKRGWF